MRGEGKAEQQAADREAGFGRPGDAEADADGLQHVGSRRAAGAGRCAALMRAESSAPQTMPAPKIGQNRSISGEPGIAARAITGRKVAVTM